jgi:hypothetical protein
MISTRLVVNAHGVDTAGKWYRRLACRLSWRLARRLWPQHFTLTTWGKTADTIQRYMNRGKVMRLSPERRYYESYRWSERDVEG